MGRKVKSRAGAVLTCVATAALFAGVQHSYGAPTQSQTAATAGGVPSQTHAVSTQPASEWPIQKSPAVTAQQLLVLPESSWITNGGTLYNQRYSPLALLNRANVAGLKALWRWLKTFPPLVTHPSVGSETNWWAVDAGALDFWMASALATASM